MREKRGQAAMEFLMTYGWAILAAVIVIGVLASFGVFSPSKYVPTECILSAPLGCVAVAADTTNGVQVEVRNGAGGSITITNLIIDGCTGTVSPAVGAYVMIDQNVTVFANHCSSGELTLGEKFQGDITVTYTSSGSTLAQTASGSITVEVQ